MQKKIPPVLVESPATEESNVRTYNRLFENVFTKGEGVYVYDVQGKRFIDFLNCAGALNYGHNHPVLKQALLNYIESNGVVSTLDLNTTARQAFLSALNNILLVPRHLHYRCQFCGPTGTNTVEAALKLARKVTGRKNIVAFSNSFHGMTMGSMSVSASFRRRKENYLNPDWVNFMPFDGLSGLKQSDRYIRSLLTTNGSGMSQPAAFIIELVQGEGGVNVASYKWVQSIYNLAKELGSLFIVDEIQTGCGRTGKFFSFEHYDIKPDLVCVSKSISGFGLPMALLLISPELDGWSPGEHNGTFRGFNYSFVTATEALNYFWTDGQFIKNLEARTQQLTIALATLQADFKQHITEIKQLGMIAGIQLSSQQLATQIQRNCFNHGLMIECCDPLADTLKLLPALVISASELDSGLTILRNAIETETQA